MWSELHLNTFTIL